jgi:hypothetical protein
MKIRTIFEIRKLGEPSDCFGMHIHRDEDAGTITIEQEDQARTIAEEFGVANWQKATHELIKCLQGHLWDFKKGNR